MAVVPSTAPSATGLYDEDEYDEYEEGYLAPVDDSVEMKRMKLFVRPHTTPAMKQLCGTKGIRSTLDTKAIPHCDKLTIRRKTRLDLIRDQIPRPEGSVPPTALPSWFEMDMKLKIPYVKAPEKYIYYARGKLGEPLHRCHPFYTVYDQRNQDRVVTTPYNALHDPSVRTYLFQPGVKSFLGKQGFINERNEVFCSHREFNQFRGYLGTMFNDEVGDAVFRRDSDWKYQRQQMVNIQNYLSSTMGRQAFLNSRRIRAKAFQREARQNRMHKHYNRERHIETQMTHFREQKAQENLIRVMMGYQRDKKTAERLYRLRFERMMVQREILKNASVVDVQAETRKRNNIILAAKTTELAKINWLDSKLEFGRAKMERNRQLEEALRVENETNASKRQRRVEHDRAMLPARIEMAKEITRKKWEIVRKFAMRWLDKVRRRLNAPKDLNHESVWIGKSKGVLDDTLKYLKELSGYEKLDDFILNIIKLKRQIQHQIELEEAEEAVAAAAGERGEVSAEGAQPGSDLTPVTDGSNDATGAPPTTTNSAE
ncbi:uncharacterized protein LOC118434358 [Folsomia candida]|uniref:Fibrous sheath-interacting protein 2 n=1 Tax=Folsomia candida TaxID=158441 RepID=A0A226EPS1_FOLCA|nr:uncharacterized protein LOC118434358 [Folsomia candida]OXA59280.1 Fibrous sheath-interacting protein 2 [Folsomia candida]